MAGCNSCSGLGLDEMVLVHVSPGFKIILLSMPPHQISSWDVKEEEARQLRLTFIVFWEREAGYSAPTDTCSPLAFLMFHGIAAV